MENVQSCRLGSHAELRCLQIFRFLRHIFLRNRNYSCSNPIWNWIPKLPFMYACLWKERMPWLGDGGCGGTQALTEWHRKRCVIGRNLRWMFANPRNGRQYGFYVFSARISIAFWSRFARSPPRPLLYEIYHLKLFSKWCWRRGMGGCRRARTYGIIFLILFVILSYRMRHLDGAHIIAIAMVFAGSAVQMDAMGMDGVVTANIGTMLEVATLIWHEKLLVVFIFKQNSVADTMFGEIHVKFLPLPTRFASRKRAIKKI